MSANINNARIKMQKQIQATVYTYRRLQVFISAAEAKLLGLSLKNKLDGEGGGEGGRCRNAARADLAHARVGYKNAVEICACVVRCHHHNDCYRNILV